MEFTKLLNYIMKKENLTRKQISEITGVPRSSISEYISGKHTPDEKKMEHIINALGYDLKTGKKKQPASHKPKKSKKDNVYINKSGSYDPTAGDAICRVDAERERFQKVLDAIFAVCDAADFHVEGRIVLKDRKTGRVWN